MRCAHDTCTVCGGLVILARYSAASLLYGLVGLVTALNGHNVFAISLPFVSIKGGKGGTLGLETKKEVVQPRDLDVLSATVVRCAKGGVAGTSDCKTPNVHLFCLS